MTFFKRFNRVVTFLIKNVILYLTGIVLFDLPIWELRTRAIKACGIRKRLYSGLYHRRLHEFGADIPLDTLFEGQVFFPHSIYGVFISYGAKIGRDCVIFQHVVIGSNTLPDSKNKGSPSIGSRCYIGTGAKIIGGIKVGESCRIGANCVVTDDVPDNSVVVMKKPRVIKKEKLLNRYVPYRSFQKIFPDS